MDLQECTACVLFVVHIDDLPASELLGPFLQWAGGPTDWSAFSHPTIPEPLQVLGPGVGLEMQWRHTKFLPL